MELDFLPRTSRSTSDGLSSRKLEGLIHYQPRAFTCLEIETSTRCNLSCPTCPRTAYRESWIDRDMCIDNFYRLSCSFDHFETIHFRGWGEPLLNPCFPEMARTAYQSGARLVLTTNAGQAIPPGLLPYFDALIFRLEYGQASTYERRNPGARFNRAIFNISQVLHHRDVELASGPQVIILFAKNKYSIRELPSYMETAVRLRPDRVVFHPSTFHVRAIDAVAQSPSDVGPELIAHVDDRLAAISRAEGLDMLNLPIHAAQDCETVCPYESRPDLFVNWRGRASACRNSCLPVAGEKYVRYLQDKVCERTNRYLGNLLEEPLENILPAAADGVSRPPCRWAKNKSRRAERRSRHPRPPITTGKRGEVLYLRHGAHQG